MTDIELKKRIIELVGERNATGLAIERAISGRLPLTDHPLAERFRMIAGLSAARNALGVQVDNLEQQRDELLASLQRLISSDQHIEMFPTSELEICANNEALPPTLREQAASVIQARAVIAMVKGGAKNHFPDAGKMVPDELDFDVEFENGEYARDDEQFLRGRVDGWNACRDAMLAAAPKPAGGAA